MIEITEEDYLKIRKRAEECLPEEACGLIAGVIEDGVKKIRKVYILTNTEHSEIHFTIDPVEHLAAVKDMRKQGLVPLGNWHSHPESPSRQSAEDIRMAYDSTASYMIISMMDRSAPVLNSFNTIDGKSIKEDLSILWK